jgi:predicted Na+-dependent transporter
MTAEQLNQLINLLASITLFEMMVAIGLGVSFRDVLQNLPALPQDSPALAIDGGRVVPTLLVAQFLPLCVGLAVRQWRPTPADKLKKPANLLSTLLNLTMLGSILYVQFDMLSAIHLRAFVGMLALVLAGVAAGWLVGGGGGRSAMVMATSVRNVGVSLVIVTTAFPGTGAVLAATAFGIFQTVVMALIALGWGRLVLSRFLGATYVKQPS